MSSMANAGGMLPEQVFPDGAGTGSATPLAWAHAEYIVFTYAVKQAQAASGVVAVTSCVPSGSRRSPTGALPAELPSTVMSDPWKLP
jgi:hypothetical protein